MARVEKQSLFMWLVGNGSFPVAREGPNLKADGLRSRRSKSGQARRRP